MKFFNKVFLIKCAAIVLCAATMTFTATACQKNPESSIVKQKDLDKMLELANKTGLTADDFIGNFDSYKTSFGEESLKVTVNVDATVSVPQVDKLSVVRVSLKPITQDTGR